MEQKVNGGLGKWFRELKQEFKKVVWPTWGKLRQNTMIVIVYIALVGVVIAALDALFKWGMTAFIYRP